MSIYNMIASIVGGGGGGEMEHGTLTGIIGNSGETITFTDTHTTPPDIFYIQAASSFTLNTNSVASTIYINGYDGAFSNTYPLQGFTQAGDIFTESGKGTIYSNAIYDDEVSGYMASSYIIIRHAGDYSYSYTATYEWWAIWANGSGGGGGGGGGTAKNVQTNQTTSRTSSTALTSVNSLTCSTAGTYDVYWTCDRSSTSGTWSSQLYLGGTAYGSEQTTWSNHVQTVHLSNVSISANQTVAVYVKARGTNYYGYAPQLTIVQS